MANRAIAIWNQIVSWLRQMSVLKEQGFLTLCGEGIMGIGDLALLLRHALETG